MGLDLSSQEANYAFTGRAEDRRIEQIEHDVAADIDEPQEAHRRGMQEYVDFVLSSEVETRQVDLGPNGLAPIPEDEVDIFFDDLSVED